MVLRTCQYYLCDVKPEGVTYLVNLLSRVVQLYPTHSPVVMEPLLPIILRKLLEEEVWLIIMFTADLFPRPVGLPSHHQCLPDPGGQGTGTPTKLLLHTPGEDLLTGTANSMTRARNKD